MQLEKTKLARSKPGARPGTKGSAKRKRVNLAGRPTAAELERRKERVMDVATDLFVTQGYSATSLVDIAKGAGVATRTLYQHFGDKEAMFREVIFARDTGVIVERPVVATDDTLFTALQRVAQYACDVTFTPRSVNLMRLMIAESNRFPDFMQTVATSILDRFRRNVEKVFQSLEAGGVLPASDHARSAELLIDFILGSRPILTYTNWAAEPPQQADLDERVELFILGRFGSAVAKTSRTRKVKTVAAAA